MTENFIGRGENPAIQILSEKLDIPIHKRQNFFDDIGIYAQISIPKLIKQDYEMPVAIEQKKSSIDILVHDKDHKLIAVRIQNGDSRKNKISGHQGDIKSKFDKAQRNILLDNGISVVDIPEYECKFLFKDKVSKEAEKELMFFYNSCIHHPGYRDPRVN